jgi:hypothetical protein
MLPLYLLIVRWLARFGVVGFLPLLLGNWLGWRTGLEPATYLTVFGFGVLLAALEARPDRTLRMPQTLRPWMLVTVAVLVTCAMAARPYPVLLVGSAAAVGLALHPGRF